MKEGPGNTNSKSVTQYQTGKKMAYPVQRAPALCGVWGVLRNA